MSLQKSGSTLLYLFNNRSVEVEFAQTTKDERSLVKFVILNQQRGQQIQVAS